MNTFTVTSSGISCAYCCTTPLQACKLFMVDNKIAYASEVEVRYYGDDIPILYHGVRIVSGIMQYERVSTFV